LFYAKLQERIAESKSTKDANAGRTLDVGGTH
jgi:hypothetical protein